MRKVAGVSAVGNVRAPFARGKRRAVMKILGKLGKAMSRATDAARERITADKNAADDVIIPLITSK